MPKRAAQLLYEPVHVSSKPYSTVRTQVGKDYPLAGRGCAWYGDVVCDKAVVQVNWNFFIILIF